MNNLTLLFNQRCCLPGNILVHVGGGDHSPVFGLQVTVLVTLGLYTSTHSNLYSVAETISTLLCGGTAGKPQ